MLGSIQACQLQKPWDSTKRSRVKGSFTCSYIRPSRAFSAACSSRVQTGQPGSWKASKS